MGEIGISFNIVIGEPEMHSQYWRHKCRLEITVKWSLKKKGVMVWTAFICLKLGTSGWLL
jgi:hypothetical protein